MSYDEAANRGIKFPLPVNARNIQYADYGFGMAFTLLVRFDAPVADCLEHAETVLRWHDKDRDKVVSYPREEVDHVETVNAFMLEPAPWFNPSSITHGLHIGGPGSSVPEIWVDRDRGVFYYKETD